MTRVLTICVLSVALATPISAEPPKVSFAEWSATSCTADHPARTGFLLPTLAAPASGGVARIAVTSNALRGVAPLKSSRTAVGDQASSAPQKSWFERHWKWVAIPAVALLATVVLINAWACAGC